MKAEVFEQILGAEFYTGVPDSQLKPLCNDLMNRLGVSDHHVIAANEGNSTALAAGYYLATGKVPVVYMQNSGIGNVINPVASLLNEEVYGIPCIFIVGWRGEPGLHDEPQHIFQGKVTVRLLEDMGIATMILDSATTEEELSDRMEEFRTRLDKGKSVAIIVKKNALSSDQKVSYKNTYGILREDAIRHIVNITGDDIVISTTGKASRELFEIREAQHTGHQRDFLTVGSMGHSSSIALGIAMNKKNSRVWCIDGDGAALMHMGSMAVIGSHHPDNLVHIILNNNAHETVGGMPTVARDIDFIKIAEGCGYTKTLRAGNLEELDRALAVIQQEPQLTLLEVCCGLGSREDLGRPTTTAAENKRRFMEYLQTKN